MSLFMHKLISVCANTSADCWFPASLHLFACMHGLSCLPVPFVQMCSNWRVFFCLFVCLFVLVFFCCSTVPSGFSFNHHTDVWGGGGGGCSSDRFQLASELTLKQFISWNPLRDNAFINMLLIIHLSLSISESWFIYSTLLLLVLAQTPHTHTHTPREMTTIKS